MAVWTTEVVAEIERSAQSLQIFWRVSPFNWPWIGSGEKWEQSKMTPRILAWGTGRINRAAIIQIGNPIRRACCCYCCSVTKLCQTVCDPFDCSTPGLPAPHHSWSFPKFVFIALVMPSSHLILWHPLILLLSVFPSIRDFSNESSVHISWPEVLQLKLQLQHQHQSFQGIFRVDLP